MAPFVRFWPRDYRTQRDDIFDKRWEDDDTPWLDNDAEDAEDVEGEEDGT